MGIFRQSAGYAFNLSFNFQELVFVAVFLTLDPYFSHSSLYHSGFVLSPTFIFVILIFQLLKN